MPPNAPSSIASRQVLRYAGYVYDAESGMYYCSARTYDPNTMQFLQKDPAKADGEESAYQYCGGDPVGKIDPSGRKAGDRFSTVRAAALDFALVYNLASIKDKKEYGSAIYKIAEYSLGWSRGIRLRRAVKYSYTRPWKGSESSVMPNILVVPDLVDMNIIVSTIHTHANYNPYYDGEYFSTGKYQDTWWSNQFRMDSYVVTPGGALKKYTYSTRSVSTLSTSIPKDPNSPVYY